MAGVAQVGQTAAADPSEGPHRLHPHVHIAAAGGVVIATPAKEVFLQSIRGAQLHLRAADDGATTHFHAAGAEDVVAGAGTRSSHTDGVGRGHRNAIGPGVDASPIAVAVFLVGKAGDLQLLPCLQHGIAADAGAAVLVGGAARFGTSGRHRHQTNACRRGGGIGNHLILRFGIHHDGRGPEGGASSHCGLHLSPLRIAERLVDPEGGMGHHLAKAGADATGTKAGPIGHRPQRIAPQGRHRDGVGGDERSSGLGQHGAGDGGLGFVHQDRTAEQASSGGHANGIALAQLLHALGTDREITSRAKRGLIAEHPRRDRIGELLIHGGGTHHQRTVA